MSRLPVPVIVTVPMLVSTFCKMTLPVMFSTPPFSMVKGSPLKVPPDQLNDPPIVTELVKFIVPLVKLMVSVDAGTPAGIQLVGLNQSVDTEPFQVKLAAEQQPTLTRTNRQSRGSRMDTERCRFI